MSLVHYAIPPRVLYQVSPANLPSEIGTSLSRPPAQPALFKYFSRFIQIRFILMLNAPWQSQEGTRPLTTLDGWGWG